MKITLIYLPKFYLMRHANANFINFADRNTENIDSKRELDEKGISQVNNVSNAIKSELKDLDLVYCSNAKRTKQTYESLKKHFLNNPTINLLDSLYKNRGEYNSLIWKILKNTENKYKSVIIIAHNPGLTMFYNSICLSHSDPIHFPTLGLAEINCITNDWKSISEESCISKSILT